MALDGFNEIYNDFYGPSDDSLTSKQRREKNVRDKINQLWNQLMIYMKGNNIGGVAMQNWSPGEAVNNPVFGADPYITATQELINKLLADKDVVVEQYRAGKGVRDSTVQRGLRYPQQRPA